MRWKVHSKIGPGWISIGSPWLLLPLLLQNRWFRSQEGLWELSNEATSPFSLSYLPENLGHAAVYFFNWSPEYPNSLLLTIVGGISLLFLFIVSGKRYRNWLRLRPRDYDVLGLWGLVLIGHMMLILVYHTGKLDSHFATRLGMPLHLILIIAPVWLLVKEKLGNRFWNVALGLAVFFVIAVAGPHSSKAMFTKKNFAEREFQWGRKLLSDQSPQEFLVIDSRDTYWVSMQWQSIHMDLAKTNRDLIHKSLREGEYRDVFVIQRISYDPVNETANVWEMDQLPGFQLELIDEYASRPFHGSRLSRLKP